jgi:UDPglucose 6-dehydrogenase
MSRATHRDPLVSEAQNAVGIMGAGWVGLVTAACFAELGYDVFVRDIDEERIRRLRANVVPIHEQGLTELLTTYRDRLHFTVDANEVFTAARIVFVCVGTPPTYSGDADLSAVWHLVREIPEVGSPTTLVMKSTVPVGTGAKVRAELDSCGLTNVGYVSNPEFLAEGTAVRDFRRPNRIVIGSFDAREGDAVAALYSSFDAPICRTDVASAEMIKYASNAFLATKISFINEIANVCEETGADVKVVAEGMGLDERIGPHFLQAGLGYGGSCFPKDVAALKQLAGNSGYHFELLNAVVEVNELQKRRVLTKLKWHLGSLRGRRVALLGLAFKPNTNDVREAASLVLASRLLAEGAFVRGWDPVALDEASSLLGDGVELCDDVLAAVDGADAAVVVTEWPELRNVSLAAIHAMMRVPLIIDGRNALDPEAVRSAGFAYEPIGRPEQAMPLAETVPLPAHPPRRHAHPRLRHLQVEPA